MAASESVWRGVRYAFGAGLDPRLKDGVRAHPSAALWGASFHISVFAALAAGVLTVSGHPPVGAWRSIFSVLLAAGIVSAAALLIRRWRSPALRAISRADDYVSTTLLAAVFGTGLLALVVPGLTSPFAVTLSALVLYAPFGKIRHCVLFFLARTRYGVFIGRRGLFTPRAPGA